MTVTQGKFTRSDLVDLCEPFCYFLDRCEVNQISPCLGHADLLSIEELLFLVVESVSLFQINKRVVHYYYINIIITRCNAGPGRVLTFDFHALLLMRSPCPFRFHGTQESCKFTIEKDSMSPRIYA